MPIPDELDIFIMREIFNAHKKKKEIINWDIAIEYTKECGETDLNRFVIAKHYKRIKERIKNYVLKDIFFVSKNKGEKEVYTMDSEKVTFVKHKFSDGYKDCIMFRINGNKI